MSKASNLIWEKVRQESFLIKEKEPLLAELYSSFILDHKTFSRCLSFILSNKIESSFLSQKDLNLLFKNAYQKEPRLVDDALRDLDAVINRDPAIKEYVNVLLHLKGYHALQAYRLTHWLWKSERTSIALLIQNIISVQLQVDIHPAAKIGSGVMFDHATGIVIGETSIVSDNVSILQNVTLGGTGKESGDRHPKIGEGVMIGAGSKVLGNISIGKGAKIAAGSVVLENVPGQTTVAGVPAKIIGRPSEKMPAQEMDQFIKNKS